MWFEGGGVDASASGSERVAGVIVDAGRGRVFVGADQAIGVLGGARLSPVAGAPLSMFWFEGEVLVALPFLACAGDEGRPAAWRGGRAAQVLIGELGGRRYGLTDVMVLASGTFERVPLPRAPTAEVRPDAVSGAQGAAEGSGRPVEGRSAEGGGGSAEGQSVGDAPAADRSAEGAVRFEGSVIPACRLALPPALSARLAPAGGDVDQGAPEATARRSPGGTDGAEDVGTP